MSVFLNEGLKLYVNKKLTNLMVYGNVTYLEIVNFGPFQGSVRNIRYVMANGSTACKLNMNTNSS